MKHAKKLLCLALALVMSLSLVACSSSSDGKADNSNAGAGIDHDREVVYGSASLITNFNVKYVTSQNDLPPARTPRPLFPTCRTPTGCPTGCR